MAKISHWTVSVQGSIYALYAGFESILKPVDERYREKINKMKAERKGKTPYCLNHRSGGFNIFG